MNIIDKSWGLVRRLRGARAWRRGTRQALPACALAEVCLGAAQAAWLLRTVCNWHALPVQGTADVAGTAMPLALVMQRLAARGVQLQACRLMQAQDLQRGDVLMLGDDAAQRLFGGPQVSGAGMALVIETGSSHLRLSPALAPDPLSCRWTDVRGSLVGWVLRSRRSPVTAAHQLPWPAPSPAGASA